MAIVTTFLTTPTVMAIYQPARAAATSNRRPNSCEFRILACALGPAISLIKLTESTRSADKSSRLKIYIMHLVELTERSSSIIMVRRFRKNGLPFINRLRAPTHLADPLSLNFQTYSQLGKVSVRPVTAVSALATMHEDILMCMFLVVQKLGFSIILCEYNARFSVSYAGFWKIYECKDLDEINRKRSIFCMILLWIKDARKRWAVINFGY